METATKRRIGDIFVERRLINHQQLEAALTEQRASGGRLGEILVDLGMVTRVALAGVILEQWDELRLTEGGRKNAETEARESAATEARQSAATGSTVVELALRDRLETLTAELAARDARIAQQDATIAALLARPA
jgi:MSHA biogenesis protein MshE